MLTVKSHDYHILWLLHHILWLHPITPVTSSGSDTKSSGSRRTGWLRGDIILQDDFKLVQTYNISTCNLRTTYNLTLNGAWHCRSSFYLFWLRQEPSKSLCVSVRPAQVCLKHWIFIFLSWVCLRTVSGQCQVSVRSVSGQSQVCLKSMSGQSQVLKLS